MRTSLRVVGATCAAVLVLPACTSSSADPGDGDSETVVPAVTTAPTTSDEPTASPMDTASPEDPFAVPDPITEEYVDRVVNTLYEEWGAITREILEEPADPSAITPVETRERMTELFAEDYLNRRFSEADSILRGDRDNLLPRDELSSVSWKTRHIFVAGPKCLVVAGDFDTSGTARSSTSILTALSLQPASDARSSVNPTGWRIRDGLANTGKGGTVFDDEVMLNASVEDFGDLLTTTCSEGNS